MNFARLLYLVLVGMTTQNDYCGGNVRVINHTK